MSFASECDCRCDFAPEPPIYYLYIRINAGICSRMSFASECDYRCDFAPEPPIYYLYIRINAGICSRMSFASECDLQQNAIYFRINLENCSRMSFALECDLQQNIICIRMRLQMRFCSRTSNLLSLDNRSILVNFERKICMGWACQILRRD